MLRVAVGASAVLVTLLLVPATFAQSPSIALAVDPVDANLSVSVLREGDPTTVCTLQISPPECDGSSPTLSSSLTFGIDAAGNLYTTNVGGELDFGGGRFGYQLLRTDTAGHLDVVAHLYTLINLNEIGTDNYRVTYRPNLGFDQVSGRLLLGATLVHNNNPITLSRSVGVLALSGFVKMFDTLLTFMPSGQISSLVPGLPDGFRSADSLQVWTGNVRSMPDWSQAQPLACMAAQNPTPGQIVTVPDTLPDPPVGQGRYYLVASQSGAERRLGRQYVNGAFSARVPTGLPVCE